MDRLLQSYLDGDLTPTQARELEERLRQSPALEAELRALEGALAALTAPLAAGVSPGFADRVMAAVRAADVDAQVAARERRPTWLRAPAWPMAASLVFCFIAGYLVAERGLAGRSPQPSAGPAAADVQLAASPDGAAGDLRLVRLVFPDPGAARTVSVAGDFNAWQPEGLPLSRHRGVWTIDLALPPGIYEYMFVVDGQQWVTDPLARATRDDGYGGANAILDLAI